MNSALCIYFSSQLIFVKYCSRCTLKWKEKFNNKHLRFFCSFQFIWFNKIITVIKRKISSNILNTEGKSRHTWGGTEIMIQKSSSQLTVKNYNDNFFTMALLQLSPFPSRKKKFLLNKEILITWKHKKYLSMNDIHFVLHMKSIFDCRQTGMNICMTVVYNF